MFELVWGKRLRKKFPTLEEAIRHGRVKIENCGLNVISISNEGGAVVCVITDDANAISTHHLAELPEQPKTVGGLVSRTKVIAFLNSLPDMVG